MARARSGSIFCWPRTRADFFLRECFREVLRAAEDLCALVVGFFAELSWAPAAGISTQPSISAAMPIKRAVRIVSRSRIIRANAFHSGSKCMKKKPNQRLALQSCSISEPSANLVGQVQVTEVYRRGRWCRPAGRCRAAAPGKPHPGRSSGSIQSWRSLLRCSPAAC